MQVLQLDYPLAVFPRFSATSETRFSEARSSDVRRSRCLRASERFSARRC